MNLFPFLLVTLAAFAILHFAWIPSAERRFRIDRSMATIKYGALLSLLGFARGVLLIATLTTAALIVAVLILQMFGGGTAAQVTSAIERIHRWRTLLVGIGPWWGGGVTLMLILALGIYARRRGRVRMEKTFQQVFDRKFEQLKKDFEEGTAEDLLPTSEMQGVAAQLNQAATVLERLSREDLLRNPEAVAERQRIAQQAAMLERYYVALDLDRRIKLELDPDEVALPEARTRWEKVQTFFISRGLLASLNRTSRALFLASLILLVPSLTGVCSASTAATLDERLVSLKDLRVELSRKEFENEKTRLGEAAAELKEEDRESLRQVARAYEQTAFRVGVPRSLRSSMYSLRAVLTREAVLEHAAKQVNGLKTQQAFGAVLEQHHSGSAVQGLAGTEQLLVELPERALHGRGPVTAQGQRVYAELEDIARRSPSFMENVKTGLRSFQKPAAGYDITHALFNNIAGTLAGEAPGEFGSVLRGVELGNSPKLYKGFPEAQSRQFLFGLMRGAPLNEALGRVSSPESGFAFVGPAEQAEFHSVMRTFMDDLPVAKVNEKLAEFPPTLDVAPEKHVDVKKASDAVGRFKARMEKVSPLGRHEVYADTMASFSDWFPAQLGTDTRTRRGELLAQWNNEKPPGDIGGPITNGPDRGPDAGPNRRPNSGPPAPGGGPSVSKASRFSFFRGRSFGGLRGFARVGGVLIGREPEAEAAKPNFVDFRWEIEGSHVRFVLVGADGRAVRSRTHRVSVANSALNYAADGRPLAVTMTPVAPLRELKILLHPTLVDTPLGYRIIRLDQFVDTYTHGNAARKEAEERVYAHHSLYSHLWAVRALAFLTELTGARYDPELSRVKEALRETVADEELKKRATEALGDMSSITDPNKSPLTVKKEYYDQTLVELVTKAKPGTKLESLAAEVSSKTVEEVKGSRSDHSEMEAMYKRMMSMPPEFKPVSGVRELSFTPDAASILVPEGVETPVPFSYMLQVAFTSPPAFVEERGGEDGGEGYADSQPWEFPLLNDTIQAAVAKGVEGDEQARTIVADASEFTMLQRLFRLAFDGHLGPDFPVEKLVELGQVLDAGAPKTVSRTLRWLAQESDPYEAVLRAGSRRTRGAQGNGEAITDEDKEELMNIQEIRKALGVDKDSEQVSRTRHAPLPALE